jgi:hypothetical protein
MKEDAKGLQDAARLRNAAWLVQHFKSTPELKGLTGEYRKNSIKKDAGGGDWMELDWIQQLKSS